MEYIIQILSGKPIAIILLFFLHGTGFINTLDLNKPQDEIVIGVPSYSDPDELTTGFLLKLPFTNIRPWKK